ncbi:gluconate 2-dehydrogenase subunit 3-like protein [Pontibacter ummariensis]|uniref:Gluconate 2-dehydrogenase subunit 3 n=1 Tax=Pontibacter ummariensis TaxID=1610492 RepID=A0A239BAT2_9BACT|nr:gluconate 2-dehydrogenase subunit 3 family protein [Pontibacter ummariensis]PRY16409.1 gluconate 2-dehydrogenase subunit 3-like protein [Pontibacter ummariensis]SNS04661.1 Gluconate 2-dehydrogenase subunit 3 [Pontibacter ummariensis]
MERRIAIRNMALVMAGLVILPGCDLGSKRAKAQTVQPGFSPEQNALLAEVVETIIPATDTPGAKELGLHTFVQLMLVDCYEQEVRDNFVKGLDTVGATANKEFGKPFAACTEAQRTDILLTLEQSDKEEQKAFYELVKDLTILGYTTSEYVMTNLTEYTPIPGHYYGCVPVPSKKTA